MRRSVFIWVFVAAVLLCVTTLLVATYGLNEGSSRRELLSMVNYRRFHAAALEAAFDSPLSLDAFDFAMHDYAHVFGGREPPPGYREWLKMAQRDQCSTSASTYAQIYKDLGPWFRIGRIDPSLLSLIPRMFGVKEESYKADGTDQFYFMLHEIFAEGKVRPFKYVIDFHDEPVSLPATDSITRFHYRNPQDALKHNACLRGAYGNIVNAHSMFTNPNHFTSLNALLPIFAQAKPKCYNDIVMPTGNNHIKIAQRGHVNDTVSWEEKKKVMFWRGATSDGDHSTNSPHWPLGHRMRLGSWANEYALKYPNFVFDAGVSDPSSAKGPLMVDVGFHATYQCSTAVCQELKQRYPLKEKVSLEKTLEFKYLLVVDGNTWPNRIQQYIETNSVVLYNGIFEDWFLGQLKPWVHYIPVRVDLADLEEKLEWLQAHDEEAKRISKNARMFARGYNDIAQIKCYLGLLFVEYARLYDA